MKMDPISSLLSYAGKEVVAKTVKEMLRKSKNIDKTLREEFKILGREMRIECPQSIQHYSITFKTKKSRVFSKKQKFNFGKVRRVSLQPIISLQPITDAISYTENGFEINLKRLEQDTLYLLEIEYFIEDRRFIDALINKNVSRESFGDEQYEYWMVAQFKHLNVLKQEFGVIELKDIDFGVDVSVYNDIKMKVPSIFTKQLEVAAKLLSKHHGGRDEQFRLYWQLQHLKRAKYSGEVFQILEQLQDLFLPLTFKRFVDVQKDFHFYDCERGQDFYETLPFPTWPKTMKVISRTDLNFDRPAADGLLVFKRKDFIKNLERIFNKSD